MLRLMIMKKQLLWAPVAREKYQCFRPSRCPDCLSLIWCLQREKIHLLISPLSLGCQIPSACRRRRGPGVGGTDWVRLQLVCLVSEMTHTHPNTHTHFWVKTGQPVLLNSWLEMTETLQIPGMTPFLFFLLFSFLFTKHLLNQVNQLISALAGLSLQSPLRTTP